ncbi:hypothetical protein F5B22DRAFT_624753 [Xylaria bambusicola]|uniref:uncharacterized protein n=1 Tax=Xylaria bambusicola TaxID=326684 RepID=UPI0020076AAB|nr:uncharacterized protein F5B22DRAFT_624753 [Xylaria bambusicola]KAI0506238.1 hypothetical protein F5B22DRAFT_624753 [Xylaria bambusicola]
MATPRLARSPTCMSCLRRLASQQPHLPSPLSWTQTRAKATKAELEDLQGIPVRLLQDIPGFGRKHSIIRVKAGRMRNIWFPKGAAEYMTKQRFTELGLSEGAIGVRDRTFGKELVVEAETDKKKQTSSSSTSKSKRKEILALSPEEAQTLLSTLLPEVLVFPRIPVSTTPAEPAIPRSPSLAANAAISTSDAAAAEVTPIFGSVSRGDILAVIKENLVADPNGGRVALEDESLEIIGLDPEYDGDNRIKRLGTFQVRISPGVGAEGRVIESVSRTVQVVPESS